MHADTATLQSSIANTHVLHSHCQYVHTPAHWLNRGVAVVATGGIGGVANVGRGKWGAW